MIAFGLAVLSHRRRWLMPAVPASPASSTRSPASRFFFLLLPITGRGNDTAIIALTAYTLQIIFRNIVAGLANVPPRGEGRGARDGADRAASCCGGSSCRWRCRRSSPGCGSPPSRTVAIATLAVFAGGGGLGERDLHDGQGFFKTGIIIAGAMAILMAITFDLMLLLHPARLTRWRRAVPGGDRRPSAAARWA